jgi:hypothetical protein
MKNWHLLAIALFTMTFSLTACGPAELGSAESESSDECQTDGDCVKGERCKPRLDGNICVPKDDSGDSECTKNADCVSGEVCQDEICVEEDTDECNEDSDCDNGESCKANTCVTDECTSDDDCVSDEVCNKYSDKANMCVDDGDGSETRTMTVKVTPDAPRAAIVCSYELCTQDNPVTCDNGNWQQSVFKVQDESDISFDLELKGSHNSFAMNCDQPKSGACLEDEMDEGNSLEAAAVTCADRKGGWLAHSPIDPHLKGTVELTLEGETFTVTPESVPVTNEDDGSQYPASVFQADSGAGFGGSIPKLEDELGI